MGQLLPPFTAPLDMIAETDTPSNQVLKQTVALQLTSLGHHWCFTGGGSAQNHKAAGDRLGTSGAHSDNKQAELWNVTVCGANDS